MARDTGQSVNKKVIIMSSGNYPEGSWGLRLRMWAKSFLLNGYDPVIYISYPRPNKEKISNKDSWVRFSLQQSKKTSFGKFRYSIDKVFGTINSFVSILRDKQIAFIMMHQADFLTGVFAVILKYIKGVPLFCERADENGKIYDNDNKNIFSFIASINQELFELFILPHANKIFVVSTYLSDKYIKRFRDKQIIKSTPTYIDEREIQSNLKNYNYKNLDIRELDNLEDEDYISMVYAGAINRLNGIEFLFKALASLRDSHDVRNVRVYFFCLYGNKSNLANLASEFEYINNVNIIDAVPYRYLASVYSAADILLIPEHGRVIANAGFPGKTGEYLISGTPIITKDFSDLGSYLKNEFNAMICHVDDMYSYQRNLYRLITDKELRYRIGREAQNTARKYFDVKNGVSPYLNISK